MENLIMMAVESQITAAELEDVCLAYHLTGPDNAELRAERYGKFNFDELNERESMSMFRFNKTDVERLVTLVNLPEEIHMRDGHSTTGLDGLCVLLRRLAYPNRLADLECIFGLSTPYLSLIANTVMRRVVASKGHLLTNLNNLPWLTEDKLRLYGQVISEKGAPVPNCWGFIDGTVRATCWPIFNQQAYYSGHKRTHAYKYQGVVCPDGMIVSLLGPFQGRRHDAGIFRESQIYDQLMAKVQFADNNKFVLYGDSAYPILELLLKPYSRTNITPVHAESNRSMSSVRQAVEWSFGKILTEFAFIDFKKNQSATTRRTEYV